jgi:hypothetical protein
MNKSTAERTDLQYILSQILDEDNSDEIESFLDANLVPELATDEELAEEDDRNNMDRFRRPPRRGNGDAGRGGNSAAGRNWGAVDEVIERLLRDGVCVITTVTGTITTLRIGHRAGTTGGTGIPQALLDELAGEAWADVGGIVGEDTGNPIYAFPAIPVVDYYEMFNAERLVMKFPITPSETPLIIVSFILDYRL